MKGKEKCRALKEIRQKIAQENDIEFAVEECTHKGECKGTCPKCEAELRYLEKQLAIRQSLGKAVTVMGIATASIAALTGCGPENPASGVAQQSEDDRIVGKMVAPEESDQSGNGEEDPVVPLEGDVAMPLSNESGENDGDDFVTDGEMAAPESEEDPEILEGDIIEPETEPETEEWLEGDVLAPVETETEYRVEGDIPAPEFPKDEEPECVELEGDVVFEPEPEAQSGKGTIRGTIGSLLDRWGLLKP